MKATKIIFWITTTIIFLFEGVMPALTGNTQMAIDGIKHLGYPDYFRVMLISFKVLGCMVLILPFFKGRVKEWAYAGLGLTFISATVSHCAVDGINPLSFFPLILLVLLAISNVTYHKLNIRE